MDKPSYLPESLVGWFFCPLIMIVILNTPLEYERVMGYCDWAGMNETNRVYHDIEMIC